MAITRVGLTTGNFANRLLDLPDCLDRFEKLGVESVELSLGAFDIVSGGRVLPQRLAELKRVCADRPFGYTLHGPIASRFTVADQLELQKQVCRAALDVSAEIGATAQVHHSGAASRTDTEARASALAMERDALAEIAPYAAERGVMLCVETLFSNEPQEWFPSPAELAEQIRAVDHPNIRATIDFSHAAINATDRGFDLLSSLEALAPVTGHLHIHDSFGRPQFFRPFTYGECVNFGLGDLHLPPGWGGLDWDAFAALPFAEDVVANLELGMRFEDQLESAVAHCRRMIEISRAA